jgi:glycosyltransferase involved in cell wall biosynthesis
MRIVQLTPGAGDSFYCENCLRDVALVRAIRKLGHDVLMVPMYLPVQSDRKEELRDVPIFFGGVNVYLQQKWGLFRKTPRWIDRLFDSPWLLRCIGRRANVTSARDLGETTISMLQGEEGRQTKELNRLVDWLSAQENRPDIVCLSNVLLIGLARRLKAHLNVPVVCLLQDEDSFLEGLSPDYAEQAWGILAERSGDVDEFIAVSKYYADVMREKLSISANRIYVVYMGISLEGYEQRKSWPQVPTIGFLSRMCSERGLDILVDAFIILKKDEKLKNARLRIAGGSSGDDKSFVSRIRQQLDLSGVISDVDFISDFSRDAKISFLQTLSLLSVPEKKPVACGLYVLEALAAGVPVVQPASGVFPELLEMTGGGVLFEPNNSTALASAMKKLLLDSDCAQQLGRQGRQVVFEKFNVERTAKDMVCIYERIAQKFR